MSESAGGSVGGSQGSSGGSDGPPKSGLSAREKKKTDCLATFAPYSILTIKLTHHARRMKTDCNSSLEPFAQVS